METAPYGQGAQRRRRRGATAWSGARHQMCIMPRDTRRKVGDRRKSARATLPSSSCLLSPKKGVVVTDRFDATRPARPIAAGLVLVLGLCSTVMAQDRMPPIPADKMTDAQVKAAQEFKAA